MHRSIRSCARFALVCSVLVSSACGDGGDDDGDGGGSSPSTNSGGPAATNCLERCSDKAEACGAPAEVGVAQCDGVCDGSITEDQLACIEDEDCTALAQALSGSGDVCGLGGGSASASGGSASASGGSASATGSTPSGEIGDPCECSDPEADYESCSGTGSSCGDLTCYVIFGDGICSESCTVDANGDSCPVGECTDQIVNGLVVGTWCVP